MAREDHPQARDPEDRRSPGRGRSRSEGPVSRALKRGRSGYGLESLRPHLHDQLVLKDLLRTNFPPPEGEREKSNQSDGD